ncbi:MAG: hypothetical protein SP1CHLAM54_08520 [Chlamydiia bacterium]|nr:hypothetical protein [Chlamydiia bacterium]MCH9615758.1 hypothetical protein [Chlamydiia bacterium]MCH9628839.1 hypothetical protein [Chlamydiia bacterium]
MKLEGRNEEFVPVCKMQAKRGEILSVENALIGVLSILDIHI